MYYLAKAKALSNCHEFHIIAILKRGKSVIKITTNSKKTHPKFERKYRSGKSAHSLHAEMALVSSIQPGDTVEVYRWLADGTPTMAMPCVYCQKALRDAGIKKVTYTDWNGQMQTMKL